MTDSNRSRSRSPARRAPRGSKGFRWKDNSRPKAADEDGADSSRRRQDYRDRSPDRQRRREGERERRREPERGEEKRRSDRPRSPRRHEAGSSKSKQTTTTTTTKTSKRTTAPTTSAAQQEMIIVHVNDRLGTKSAIPCLPSDTIGQLKLMIAARIGRESGQIMLRRQGERPFKDMLSLEDYGISNGVQLDLEVDTGD
ncbi:hypothetical protein CP532_1658 [Ophiocordyceps camponoti-leonardi (nom. inval.)]|nr:hypothetical protein CP532_1658 [Ophiocordyceps camponoti-leonardi (nom. inval.)]